MSTNLIHTATRSDSRPSSAVVPAAAVYVLAWVVGLGMGTNQLEPDATDVAVQAHYADSAMAVAAQATLVHLLAGVALMTLTVGIAPALEGPRARAAALMAGLLAGVLSVAQALVAYTATAMAADRPAAWSRTMLDTIGTLDIVKILLLAALVTLVTVSLHGVRLPRAMRPFGFGTSVLLVLGAASFLASESLLQAALALSLVMLLIWVGTIGFLVARARRGGAA